MSGGIQPEILATFETILPEHGDLEEYLRAIGFQDDTRAASSANSDLGFDEAHLDIATLLSLIDTQDLDTHKLDAAIALSLEEVDEPIAADHIEATSTEPSAQVLVEDEIDPEDMTFEAIQSLEEAVGTETRGLSRELLESFPVQRLNAKSGWFSSNKNDPEGCPICVMEYEVGSQLLTLPCLHLYHKSCIKQWLKDSKTCPVCNTDISEPQA